MRCGIAFGSNVGDRLACLRAARAAVHRLHEGGGDQANVALASPVYETEPVGCAPGTPPYLNAVMEIDSTQPPLKLLAALQKIEGDLGRPAERPRNAPRTLDLDLLYMDGETVAEGGLNLPHPRMHERRFVLEPLNAIRPGLRLPGAGASVAELLAALPATPKVALVCGAEGWEPGA